ncbi:MAG: hypothetical protein IK094_02085 [Treponema sp.]|nr:hypothetical protein [Treponema sp.]
MISDEFIQKAKTHISESSLSKNADFFCVSRDIFQARLDSFISKTGKYIESAVIGEIGNNSIDHNWEYASGQMRGAYFNLELCEGCAVLADYGRGIRESLSKVLKLESDLEAITAGFTKQVSGRLPEQRGNGLKFVAETVKNKNWSMYFQTGNACCIIEKGQIKFTETKDCVTGCMAIINFGENNI